MKYRIIKTTMGIPGDEGFYWVIEYKKHWWSPWKMIERFDSDNHCPLFFKSKQKAIDYLKG